MIWRKSSGSGGAIFGGGGKVNVEHWRCVHTLRCHNGDILDLAWSLGDKLLATASVDNTVRTEISVIVDKTNLLHVLLT